MISQLKHDWVPDHAELASDSGYLTFSPKLQYLRLGRKTIEDPDLKARYDSDFQLKIDYEHDSFLDVEEDAYALPEGATSEVKLLVTRQQMEANCVKVTCFPMRSPVMLFGGEISAQKAVFSLLNGPDLFFYQKVLRLENEDFTFEIKQAENSKDLFKNKRDFKESAKVTHKVTAYTKDGIEADPSAFFAAAFFLANFLTFVRGGYVGIGHMVGIDCYDEVQFASLGFNKFDDFALPKGWFDIEQYQELPGLFRKFTILHQRKDDSEIARNCLEFYRASNSIRGTSLEMAIVASHAALETIVPYILKVHAGWTNELLGGRSSFHSKFRAAAAFIGLACDPLEHAPQIVKKAKSFKNADGFEMSSIFRNRIVHQGSELSYDGLDLIEIWELQQWMVEIFIFYLMGHRGTMNDRRRYTGWRGPGVEIPLP